MHKIFKIIPLKYLIVKINIKNTVAFMKCYCFVFF